jgi:ferredoxin-NADP reductase
MELVQETPDARSLVLDVPGWPGHLPGQHVDVRVTDETGYQSQRSYSLASAPEDGYLVLTIQRLKDGEVSSYLAVEVRVGDALELRGPIGGYFVWNALEHQPTQLIAGGSGIVPFRAVLRHWDAMGHAAQIRLLYSARSPEAAIYRDQLMRFAAYDEVDIRFAFTRRSPSGWRGHQGRIGRALLERATWSPEQHPLVLVCGPITFVEAMANILIALGHDSRHIRTERFGPTGT